MVDAVEIAQYYTSLCNLVDMINAGKPESMEDAEWEQHRTLNIEWLQGVVAKDFWTNEDMTAVNTLLASE